MEAGIKKVGDRLVVVAFDKEIPERLDRFLAASLPEFSRTRIQGLVKDGFVTVNGVPVSKAGHKLESGSLVKVSIPPVHAVDLQAEDIPLDVIFENGDLLVINKPSGMVVHPSAGHEMGTLVNAALGYAPDIEGIGGEQRPGVVHRLDKQTSGLILLAKNERALRWLQDQFRARLVSKTYLALVDGAPPTLTGRVEAPIGRDPLQRKRMSILPPGKGRQAVSEYKVVERFPAHTLVEVYPLTGRTHQIRLHLAFLNCPVVGDVVYGHRKPSLELGRHFLHAARLSICLPGEKSPRTFEAPLPGDLLRVLQSLRGE